jgi:hypothetical protein
LAIALKHALDARLLQDDAHPTGGIGKQENLGRVVENGDNFAYYAFGSDHRKIRRQTRIYTLADENSV